MNRKRSYSFVGGLSGLLGGIAGYLFLFYQYKSSIVGLESPVRITDATLIGSLPRTEWLVLYLLTFFGIGAVIGMIIWYAQERKWWENY